MDIKQLHEEGQALFSKRSALMLFWQEVADNFYPERADFTASRNIGDDFASNLTTSYPLLCRRELQDQIGQMLHPTEKQWFNIAPLDPGRNTVAARRWLERARDVQRRAMYDKRSFWVQATKQADGDFATFGQFVKQIRLNKHADALLYRTHHLRDVVWIEDENGQVSGIWRKWKPTAIQLKRLFGDKVSDHVQTLLRQNKPNEEVDCMHIICSADMFDEQAMGRPWWSIYIECQKEHVLEKVAQWNQEYNIARWQTVSGSQYAYSPATIAGLPDARLLQSMTYTLLEAGEMAARPPLIATKDVIRSDVSLFSGGITWIDRDYDERLGDALRALNIDAKGLPFGLEMLMDTRGMLMQAFYLNKLQLPQRGKEMTAYEVGQRIQEYIRGALPLFEPMEMEANGGDCELTFDILLRNGAFGSPLDMPKELMDADYQFHFESPLHDAVEQAKGEKFREMLELVAAAISLDQTAAAVPDSATALREVLLAIGTPAKWVRDETEVRRIVAAQQEETAQRQLMEQIQQGADVASTMATARREDAAADSMAVA